jgi:hypothetical protein
MIRLATLLTNIIHKAAKMVSTALQVFLTREKVIELIILHIIHR